MRLAHFECGVEIGVLNEELDTLGLAMPTLGGANGQTLAGAFSTSTHGGDIYQPPVPDFVRALHLVTIDGRELWIEPASAPVTSDERLRPVLTCQDTEIIRDDSVFYAALVSVGRFGVIYSVIIQVTAAFRLLEWTVVETSLTMLETLLSGINAGSPLKTVLAALPKPDMYPEVETPETPHFLQILFNSQNTASCYVTRRWKTKDLTDVNIDPPQNPFCAPGGPQTVLVAAAAALTAQAIRFMWDPLGGPIKAAKALQAAGELIGHSADPGLSTGDALALSLNAAWGSELGEVAPLLSTIALNGQFKPSQDGRRGLSHVITSGTRASNADRCYLGASIEAIFAADQPEYVHFLQEILATAPDFHQTGYISLRYSALSRATLSMHNHGNSPVVSIEIASIRGMEGNAEWLAFAEKVAIARGGRPHWGQINRITDTQVSNLYGPNLASWRETLRAVSGTSAVFSNHFTRQRGLEPFAVLRAVRGAAAVAPLSDGRLELWATDGNGGMWTT